MNNVRAVLTAKQWNALRGIVADKAYNVCEICGGVGPKHPVQCHEIWSFDNKKLVQKLEGMIALCPDCHMVKHIGLAEINGKKARALRHLMSVNKMTINKAEEYVTEAFKVWAERSKKTWTLDISHLEEYGIDVNKLSRRS